MNYPKVSVFTLIYNTNPEFVIDAIKSVRSNNYPNLQHIIIDDGSPKHECWQMVKKWIDDENYPCEFIVHEKNMGLCKTLNHVLDLSTGKYLAACCDDILLPHKLKEEVEIFETLSDDYAAVYTDVELIDENNNLLDGTLIKNLRGFEKYPDGHLFDLLTEGNFLPPMGMLWRIDRLFELGKYDESLQFEDYDMHLRLSKLYKIKFIDKIGAQYRQHSTSLKNNLTEINYQLYLIFRKHLDTNPELKEKVNLLKLRTLQYSNNDDYIRTLEVPYVKWIKIIKKLVPTARLKNFAIKLIFLAYE